MERANIPMKDIYTVVKTVQSHLSSWKTTAMILTLGIIICLGFKGWAEDVQTAYQVKSDDVLACVLSKDDVKLFETTRINISGEYKRLNTELIRVFEDQKSSNFNKCAAAYFLGEIHSIDAVNVLAPEIALEFDISHIKIDGFPMLMGEPAMQALIKIGNPAIPALVHNLQESDDVKVRDYSLKALCQIEHDNDVVRLRLQKTLDSQSGSANKARLQSAIESIQEISGGK